MSNNTTVRRVKLCDAVKNNCFVSVNNNSDDQCDNSEHLTNGKALLSSGTQSGQESSKDEHRQEQLEKSSVPRTPTSTHHVHFESDKCLTTTHHHDDDQWSTALTSDRPSSVNSNVTSDSLTNNNDCGSGCNCNIVTDLATGKQSPNSNADDAHKDANDQKTTACCQQKPLPVKSKFTAFR